MLLPKTNHFTKLVIEDCHSRVLHCGFKDTLVELWTWFWVPGGRQYVKFVIHHCLVCKKMTGASYDKPPPGDLPSFRLSEVLAFTNVGVDMAGPCSLRYLVATKKVAHRRFGFVFSPMVLPELST